MLNFVPDIVVLNYLTTLNKLTPDTKTKLTSYLEVGYQRELTYKHADGSYSAFGAQDESGSTWLTAFVIRSFAQASKHITIDSSVIAAGLKFLAGVQKDDGSFEERGVVFHKSMQGGASSGITLTAYTLITMLENKKDDAAVVKATAYLVKEVGGLTGDYPLAIAAYALALAGRRDLSVGLLGKFSGRFENVEAAGYVLLTYDLLDRTNDALIATKWLVRQRNQFGGFESTQETVVGLTALAQVATKISTASPSFRIELRFDGGGAGSRSLDVTAGNALVLQTVEIAPSVRKVDVRATGSGFCVLQVSYRYNHVLVGRKTAIDLSVSVGAVTGGGYGVKVCAGVVGDEQSNMAVVEVSAVSGFTFDVERVKEKNAETKVKVRVGDHWLHHKILTLFNFSAI
jgi:CD109 antigen